VAQFIARVELYGASGEDYSKLHAAMERIGFSRTITLQDGSVRQLPTAEYFREDISTTEAILTEVRSAASTVSRNFGAIVVEAAEPAWVFNLRQAQ
jgi:type IV secretory pathway protease TraF